MTRHPFSMSASLSKTPQTVKSSASMWTVDPTFLFMMPAATDPMTTAFSASPVGHRPSTRRRCFQRKPSRSQPKTRTGALSSMLTGR